MKIVIDISSKQYSNVQNLVSKGEYDTVSQFVSIAIDNQLQIEDRGIGAIEEHVTNSTIPNSSKIAVESKSTLNISSLLDIDKFLNSPSFGEIVLSIQGIQPNKIWLWGQMNKLFPVKVGVRSLHSQLAGGNHIYLDSFLKNAAIDASKVSRNIRNHETLHAKGRDERISAGLPILAEEKSLARYRNQFIGYKRRDGLLEGALFILGFANLINDDGKLMIGLTEDGYRFSKLLNPVLDEEYFDQAFSKSEINMLLNHIENRLQGEYAAYKWLLNKIKVGVDEREQLNQALVQDYNKYWDATPATINTQRSGLISRVFELGLIAKEKSGKNVRYIVTPQGQELLNK